MQPTTPTTGRTLSSARRALVTLTLVALSSGVVASGAAAQGGERGFELVTPVESNSSVRVAGGVTSSDGNTVCYGTDEMMLGSVANGVGFVDDAFCAYRSESGWSSKWVSGPQNEGEMGGIGARVWQLSPDGRKALVGGTYVIDGFPDWAMTPDDPTELPDPNMTPNMSGFIYEDGEVSSWINQRPLPITKDAGGAPLAATENLDRALFSSSRALLPEDSTDYTDPDLISADQDVYLWTPAGLRLVSVDEDGNDMGQARLPFVSNAVGRPGILSRDGSRAFFVSRVAAHGAPGSSETVFRWENGEVIVASPRRGPAGTPQSDIEFVAASGDGDVVYLRTFEQLTDEAPVGTFLQGLYRYRISTDELELVVNDSAQADPLGISEDGSTVVYTKAFVVYVNRNGVETPLTPLAIPGDMNAQRIASGIEGARALRISSDGRRILFVSEAQTPGVAQVYVWEEGAGVTRVSSTPQGDPTTTHSLFGNFPDFLGTETADFDQHWQWGNRGDVWTRDLQTVFFHTADALAPEDRNAVSDIYEWREGKVSLVTPGAPGDLGYYYYASTPDGSSVFFVTYRRVLPAWDRNQARDVYVARVGGGRFPEPPESAFGTPSPPAGRAPTPPAPEVDSDAQRQDGPGETTVPVVLRKLPARVTRGLAARGRVGIGLTGSRGSRVRVRAVARVGGKARTVGRTSARLKAGGTRVTVRLSKAAREQLRSRRRLSVTLIVNGAGEAKRLTVTLALPTVDNRG